MPNGLTWTLPPVLPVKSIPALLPPADIEIELRVSVCRSISRSSTDSQISFIVLSSERSHLTSAIGSSRRPDQLGISARGGILMSAYTMKYTKGDTIKKFFA